MAQKRNDRATPPPNPLDLRPAVARIVRAIDDRRISVPAGYPLIVLMGENHAMAACHGIQQLLIRTLHAQRRNFTVNFEIPHNLWGRLARAHLPGHAGDGRPGFEIDPTGQMAMNAFLGHGIQYLSHSHAAVTAKIDFCINNGINVAFNDAASRRSIIDRTDPLTYQAIRKHEEGLWHKKGLAAGQDIETGLTLGYTTLDGAGVHIRNRTMAHIATRHGRLHQADIIIIVVGVAHMFGFYDTEFRYDESLGAMLSAAGFNILPVIPQTLSAQLKATDLPPEATRFMDAGIVLHDIPTDAFEPNKTTPEAETQFLNNMRTANEGAIDFPPAGPVEHYRDRALDYIRALRPPTP